MKYKFPKAAASLLLAAAVTLPGAAYFQTAPTRSPKPAAAHSHLFHPPAPHSAPAPPEASQTPSETPTRMHAGPVYTTAVSNNTDPQFPRLKVVLTTDTLQQTMPQPADLTLLEDGVDGPHAIEVYPFGSSGYGVAAVVAIDVSGSMAGGPLEIVRDSLYRFVSDAREQDRVGVVTIADDTRWDVSFIDDRATLKTRLQQMRPRGHQTRLYDGLIDTLNKFDSSLPARRELTVISDGHDEGSQQKLQDVIQDAHDRGIAIDAIGLTRSSPLYLRSLRTLAEQTGGTFRQVHSDQELQTLISHGMERLKASPLATFEAQHLDGDGKQHRIGVRWQTTPVLTSETTFTAPSITGWKALQRKLSNLPVWAWPLAAFALLLVLFGLFSLTRGLRKKPAPVPVRARPAPPPPPARSSTVADVTPSPGYTAGPVRDSGWYDSSARDSGIRDSGIRDSGVYPTGMQNPWAQQTVKPAVPERIPAPEPAPPAPAPRKQTRLVTYFENSGNIVAVLEGLGGPLTGQQIDVHGKGFWIGYAPQNDLVIENDPTVSARHACLIFQDRLLVIEDNHSTNGTRINGELLRGSRRPLHPGDQIQIGRSICIIQAAS
jgi:hypothetical protein